MLHGMHNDVIGTNSTYNTNTTFMLAIGKIACNWNIRFKSMQVRKKVMLSPLICIMPERNTVFIVAYGHVLLVYHVIIRLIFLHSCFVITCSSLNICLWFTDTKQSTHLQHDRRLMDLIDRIIWHFNMVHQVTFDHFRYFKQVENSLYSFHIGCR